LTEAGAGVGAGVSSFFIHDAPPTLTIGFGAITATAGVTGAAVLLLLLELTLVLLLEEDTAGVAVAGVAIGSDFFAHGSVPVLTGSTTGFAATTAGVTVVEAIAEVDVVIEDVDMDTGATAGVVDEGVSSARFGRDNDRDGCVDELED
jgi:hypothetical protein